MQVIACQRQATQLKKKKTQENIETNKSILEAQISMAALN